MAALWDVAPSCVVQIDRRFREAYCLLIRVMSHKFKLIQVYEWSMAELFKSVLMKISMGYYILRWDILDFNLATFRNGK
jgi:hypothetical protein